MEKEKSENEKNEKNNENNINKISSDRDGMIEALKEAEKAFAKGEVPIGAVICDSEKNIIARAHNLRETTFDATAHAEVVAIREACRKVKNWRLEDLTLYVTLEPCPMCAGALYLSRIKRLVYGAADWKAGGCESVFNIVANPWLGHQIEVRAGLMEDECRALIKKYFARVRRDLSRR